MKKIILLSLILIYTLFQNNTYCQNNTSKIYFGQIDQEETSRILIDEKIDFSDYGEYFSSEYSGKLINKYAPYNSDSYIFYKYYEDFKPMTNIRIGDEFFISYSDNVIKSKVIGYKVNNNMEDPNNFLPILQTDINYDYRSDSNYFKNIVICSDDNRISKIDYKTSDDFFAFSIAKKAIKEHLNNTKPKSEYLIEFEEYDLFERKFIKDENEILISYLEKIEFSAPSDFSTGFTSAIFIVDNQGNILKKVKEFLYNDFNYNKVIGTVDLDNDGIFEILIETGYYEGSGYELWGFKDNNFVKICEGFYYGV
jgi:hypothetical protein